MEFKAYLAVLAPMSQKQRLEAKPEEERLGSGTRCSESRKSIAARLRQSAAG